MLFDVVEPGAFPWFKCSDKAIILTVDDKNKIVKCNTREDRFCVMMFPLTPDRLKAISEAASEAEKLGAKYSTILLYQNNCCIGFASEIENKIMPEDLFEKEELEDWAKENGFVKEK